MFGGVETGGTKTVCAVGVDGVIIDRLQLPTGDDPQALICACVEFFRQHDIQALGVGSFGPCDLDPDSTTYGFVTNSPKPGWQSVDVLGILRGLMTVPTVMTTDVTAAAFGEWRHGAGVDLNNLVYLTIGTGIGGGAVVDGALLRPTKPPEMGHLLVPVFDGAGVCPYHRGCLEGMASGPALQQRAGRPASELPDDDPAWDVEADIVACGLHNIACTLTPDAFIIGGGVGSRAALHARLRDRLAQRLAGYLPTPQILEPGLGADAGVVGALSLAQDYIQG